MDDTWKLKVYDHDIDDGPAGIFDFRSKQQLREWCYAHVVAARMEWDNVDHVCRVYLGGGTISRNLPAETLCKPRRGPQNK